MTALHLVEVFVCPLCAGVFSLRDDRTLVCAANHAFDIAREGYVHLTPPQAKKSKEPGYNRELMRSRHEFFETGSYVPVAEAMADLISGIGNAARVLDAGCGEGYYLRTLRRRAPALDLVGTDLSRPGMRTASRLDPQGAFAVANSYHLPMADASVDVVISHFSPIPIEEFARVLRPGGHLLVGSPGTDHLFSLKSAVYATPTRHNEDTHIVHDARFSSVERHVVRYLLSIPDAGTLDALFSMTPYSYGASNRERLLASTDSVFSTEVHIVFDLYQFVG